MEQADETFEAMVDLATRQLAQRMAERAVETYALYDYAYFEPTFVADFISEFVISAYAIYQIRPEKLDEEAMLVLFVNMVHENMRGVADEVAQYHRLFGQLCDLYYEQGCLKAVLVDDPEYRQMVLAILADVYLEVKMTQKKKKSR